MFRLWFIVGCNVYLNENFPAVVLDFLGLLVSLNGGLMRNVSIVKPFGLGMGIGNCNVGVFHCLVHVHVAHAVWIVWHGELVDVERYTFSLLICEPNGLPGGVDVGHFIKGETFAVFPER